MTDPDVSALRAQPRSSLDSWVGNMPGPVWTLAAYVVIAAGNLLVVLLLQGAGETDRLDLGAAIIVCLLMIASLVVYGSRTPTWLRHAYVLIIIAITTMLVMMVGTAVGAATAGIGYLTISLYSSYWMQRVQSLAYILLMAVLYAIAITRTEWTNMFAPWLVTIGTMLVLLFVLRALRTALESAATTDELTGLLNRRALDSLIAANRTDRRDRRRCLVVIDLDDFKELNDTQGHLAGDQALREFGDACRRVLRPGDMALRSGGDEFVLILERLTADAIGPVIERLHQVSPVAWSHGSADWPPRADFDEAMAIADAELYRSKGVGRSGRGTS
jgi:diguanylate cyclase (GGDEF)-like protein